MYSGNEYYKLICVLCGPELISNFGNNHKNIEWFCRCKKGCEIPKKTKSKSEKNRYLVKWSRGNKYNKIRQESLYKYIDFKVM
jgi:hypothetical protein